MAAKSKHRSRGRKGGAGGASGSDASRTHDVVKVLEGSVSHWSDYAKQTAQLAAAGNLNPGEWAAQYADLWKNLAQDVTKLSKVVFPGKKSAK